MRMEKLVFPLRQWNLISLEFVGKIAEEEEERERNMVGTRNFGSYTTSIIFTKNKFRK
jgi:hypothetical protein